MNKITKWSHTHTLIAAVVVIGGGYLAYKHFIEKPKTGGTTNFTGGEGSYFNASGKK